MELYRKTSLFSLVLGLLFGLVQHFGVVLLFIVVLVAFLEKRQSIVEIFSSLGLRMKGSLRSIFWTFCLIPSFFVVYLLLMAISYFLGPVSFPQAGSGRVPLWYTYYTILYSFFPVAVVEEVFARGYMLDRLMLEHPSTIVRALPAILLSSLLSTLSYSRIYWSVSVFASVDYCPAGR